MNEPTNDLVTVIRDEMTWEVQEIRPGEEGQRQLDTYLRISRNRAAHPPRAVPREWWNRYVAARAAFNAMERELADSPAYTVTWHVRLRLAGELVRENEERFSPPRVDFAP